jgi:hypothetical protein
MTFQSLPHSLPASVVPPSVVYVLILAILPILPLDCICAKNIAAWSSAPCDWGCWAESGVEPNEKPGLGNGALGVKGGRDDVAESIE